MSEPKRSGEIEVTIGSGNVFEDLGFPDAEERLAKSQIVVAIADIMDRRKLTQAKAAELMGIDQPKVSHLLRGRYEGFSIHRMLDFLARLGRDVDIRIGPPKAAGRRGRVRVRSR